MREVLRGKLNRPRQCFEVVQPDDHGPCARSKIRFRSWNGAYRSHCSAPVSCRGQMIAPKPQTQAYDHALCAQRDATYADERRKPWCPSRSGSSTSKPQTSVCRVFQAGFQATRRLNAEPSVPSRVPSYANTLCGTFAPLGTPPQLDPIHGLLGSLTSCN